MCFINMPVLPVPNHISAPGAINCIVSKCPLCISFQLIVKFVFCFVHETFPTVALWEASLCPVWLPLTCFLFVTETMYEYTVYVHTNACLHTCVYAQLQFGPLSQGFTELGWQPASPVILLFLFLLERGQNLPSFLYLFRNLSSDLEACSASAVTHRHVSPSLLFSLFNINYLKRKKNLVNDYH